MLKVANGQAFWGDQPDAPVHLLRQENDIDFLTMDYLAEVSLSIMAVQQEKDPSLGYASDFIDVVASMNPFWEKGLNVKIITNAGGLNPVGLAKKLKTSAKIAVVTGDAIAIEGFHTANAYLGAQPIVEALNLGAQIVITGRVADPSLTVAAAVFHYKWRWDEYDKLAGATVAGHLIECGTQVTGGYYTDWMKVPNKAEMGFPIAQIMQTGCCTITKPEAAGGMVTIETVKEQLLYEIGDPGCYLSPDVTVSLHEVNVEKECENRIRITGVKGCPPPDSLKVSATYKDGYKCEAYLTIRGEQAPQKAKACGDIILKRVLMRGFNLSRTCIEVLGKNDSFECVLHIAAADSNYSALECFSKQIAPMVTSGPQGVIGYTGGRPKIRPIYGFESLTIPRHQVKPKVEIYG